MGRYVKPAVKGDAVMKKWIGSLFLPVCAVILILYGLANHAMAIRLLDPEKYHWLNNLLFSLIPLIGAKRCYDKEKYGQTIACIILAIAFPVISFFM